MSATDYVKFGTKASSYGNRGGAAVRAGSCYRIDGESVTMQEIAERLGVTTDAAKKRLARLRGATGAVTWARLRA